MRWSVREVNSQHRRRMKSESVTRTRYDIEIYYIYIYYIYIYVYIYISSSSSSPVLRPFFHASMGWTAAPLQRPGSGNQRCSLKSYPGHINCYNHQFPTSIQSM